MISPESLAEAVSRGLITPEQLVALRALEAARTPVEEAPQDEERLRFVSGFSDVFVAIGLALFLGAAAYFLDMFSPAVMYAGLTAGCWLLAEFFTRKRRMALPSILLLVGFVAAVFMLVTALLGAFLRFDGASVVAGPIAAAAAWLHYQRFAVPITPAAGAAALVAMLTGGLYAVWPDGAPAVLPFVMVLCGFLLFAQGLRLDRLDPDRLTRTTDIAFWLHLLAGPLIVHPVMFYSGAWDENHNPVITIGLFVLLSIIALAADRRAILVSSLIYTGVALGYLAKDRGMAEGATTAFSMFVLGAVILGLSAGWKPIRRLVMRAIPSGLLIWFPRSR
jgi:hypothetical protein